MGRRFSVSLAWKVLLDGGNGSDDCLNELRGQRYGYALDDFEIFLNA